MKLLQITAVAVLSLGLAGCVVSEEKFNTYRVILKERPDVRAKLIRDCVKEARAEDRETQELIAELIDVRVEALPQTFCNRMFRSFTSGRMTYQDYKNIARGKTTPRIIRLIRGK